jgi:hypothetical protein
MLMFLSKSIKTTPSVFKPFFALFLSFFTYFPSLIAQNVGINTTTPDASAALDIKSTTRGVLVPRMATTQRTAISSPATGLLVYDNDLNSFYYYNGSNWASLVTASTDNLGNHTATQNLKLGNNFLNNDGDNEGLSVDSEGRVTIKSTTTTAPAINIMTGNTPAYRISQDNTSGFPAYTWELGGNETLFFLRDVSSSSKLPFRVYAGQNTDRLVLRNNNVGIGVNNPSEALEINGKAKTTNFQLTNGATTGYVLQSDANGNASWVNSTSLSNGNWTTSNTDQFSALSGNVGIGTSTPTKKLHVVGDTRIDAGHLEFANTGGSIFIGQDAGANDDLSNNYNIFMGFAAGKNNIKGTDNIAIGTSAGNSMSTGNGNVVLGGNAFRNNTTGTGNLALGTNALSSNSLGYNNTAIGYNAGMTNQGSGNIFLGYSAGIGASGDNKLFIDNSTTSTPLIWGDFDNDYLNINGKLGIGTTTPAQKLHVVGDARIDAGHLEFANTGESIFIGQDAGVNDNLNHNNNIYIGYETGKTGTTSKANIALGNQALFSNVSGGSNIAIGINAGYAINTGSTNIALGNSALKKNTTGYGNLALGYFALGNNVIGYENTVIGYNAGLSNTGSGNIFLGYNAGFEEQGSNKLFIDNTSTSAPLIWGDFANDILTVNGKLGIGTTTPTKGKVEITGSVSHTLGYGYLNSSGNTGIITNAANNYSLYASDRIACSEFNAFSDRRIKHILRGANSQEDLATLMKIKITDYKLIDSIAKGNTVYKKVIAQEVAEVYPNAVSKMTDVIPNIYKLTSIKDGFVHLENHDLKVGDKVKLIFGDKQELYKVLKTNEKGFLIDTPPSGAGGGVFVFGKEVNDFHTVDYEALSTLNISATQELVKQINDLKAQNATFKSDNSSMKADIEVLKAAVFKKAN